MLPEDTKQRKEAALDSASKTQQTSLADHFSPAVLQSDYITYADTSDCLVSFLSNPFTVAHVRYDLGAFIVTSCTISILEPHILRYLVLGELRSLSP